MLSALFLIDLVVRMRLTVMFSVEAALIRNRLLAQQADNYAARLLLDLHPQLIERLFRIAD